MSEYCFVTIEAGIQKLYDDVEIPSYSHESDSGMDVRAYFSKEWKTTNRVFDEDGGYWLDPMARKIIPTGIKVAIPLGYELQVRPRSGYAIKEGITVLNSPGTVDAGYRGEVGVILINLSRHPVCIKHGDRIAQFVIAPVVHASWLIKEDLDDTSRGSGGFGSTGKD